MSEPFSRWVGWFLAWALGALLISFLSGCTATIPLGREACLGTLEVSYWPPLRVSDELRDPTKLMGYTK